MGNLWLKIKVWAKVAVFALLFLYVVVFIAKNNGPQVPLWFWPYHETQASVLMLMFWAFGTGVLGTLLVQTTFKTVRQIRDVHRRGLDARVKRRAEDMEDKAGRLNIRPGAVNPEDVET